jgi:TPR repeat protein
MKGTFMEDGRTLYFEGIKKFFDGSWKDAEESFSRASLQNYAPATNVCICHMARHGFLGDTRLSILKSGWFDVEGMIYIAELNYEKEFYPQAFAWYKVAAERGSGAGYYGMASLYFDGLGVSADRDKGMDMLIESAKLGYVEAEYLLAKILIDDEDYTNALPFLMSAAEKSILMRSIFFLYAI